MGKVYVLESRGLSVSFYADSPKDPILNYNELYKWLMSHSSRKIKEFNYWYYLIDGKEYHFKLSRGTWNTWNVYQLEEPGKLFSSFENIKGLSIKDDFELKLKETLIQEELKERNKKYPYSENPPEHDAKMDLGGED